jgi:hypothetical protein
LKVADEELSAEELQRKIEEKKAKWKSGKTTMSELTREERKKRLGLIPTEEESALIHKKGLDKKTEDNSSGK